MVYHPPGTLLFEFVAVSSLRAAQLMQGALPRVATVRRPTVTAQHEVAAGLVSAEPRGPHARLLPTPPPALERVRRSNDSGRA
jgi:hypothetical protein